MLDFDAEAYADKREAGQSEREIIDGFGAPYDAAQRILEGERENRVESQPEKAEKHEEKREEVFTPAPVENDKKADKKETQPTSAPSDMTWLFVVLCIVFALPIFFTVLGLSLATLFIGLAPFIAIAGGVRLIWAALDAFINGMGTAYGFYVLGSGIAVIGAGIALSPVLFRLAKFLWKVFKNLFVRIKLFFKGKAA